MSKLILSLYWVTCFCLTHLPPSQIPVEVQGIDKAVHFIGYAILGYLLARVKHSTQFNPAKILAVLITYSLLDEATQPLVDRSFDLLDMGADITGAILGVAAYLKIVPEK